MATSAAVTVSQDPLSELLRGNARSTIHVVINFVRLAIGCSTWWGEEAATFNRGIAKAALPIFGHTRLVGFEIMGNVVVVVVPMVVVVVVPMVVDVVVVPVGAVVVVEPVGTVVVVNDVVVVDPKEVVVVVPEAVADVDSNGTVISPLRARKSVEVHSVILERGAFTDSIYWVPVVNSKRHGRQRALFPPGAAVEAQPQSKLSE